MADEAVIIELLGKNGGGDPICYTVADGTAIPKGTLMKLSGDRTMIINSGAKDPFCGILCAEKVDSDGQTRMAVYTNGIFDLTAAAAGATARGAMCAISATENMITAAAAGDFLTYAMVGMCLETHSNDEVAAVRIRK